MKKIVAAIAVLVAVLGVAPWGIGMLAEQRVNSGLDQLVETAPYLTIVDRKFERGWFTSEQEVTFEMFGPWMRAMKPQKVTEEVAKAGAAQSEPGQPATEPPAKTPPDESAQAGSPNAAASEPPPEAAPAGPNPLKFTVRNHIVHGPVLWFSALGVARVDSQLVMPEQLRAELDQIFGAEAPVKVSTRVRFFGGGTTTVSGAARDIKIEGKQTALSYDAFKFRIGYSAHLDDVEGDGGWPRFEFSDAKSGESVRVEGMSMTGTSHRVRGDLYDGDVNFSVEHVKVVGEDKQLTGISDLHYIANTTIDDDFMDIALKMGAGAIESKALEQFGLTLEEVHYDFTLRRLHLDTLDKMMRAIKASYAKPVATATELDQAVAALIKEYTLELLKHDPELVVDRLGVTTPDGDAYLKGIIKLKGVTEQDVGVGALGMLNKVDADLTFEMAQKLVKKLPNGDASVASAIEQGYVKYERDQVVSHLEFKQGHLTINGKEQGIPGVGGPPQPPPVQE